MNILRNTIIVISLAYTLGIVSMSWGGGRPGTNDDSDPNHNTGGGTGALANGGLVGDSNSAYGFNALNTNTGGENNTAFGVNALLKNTNGLGNIAIGSNALRDNIAGRFNTATGASALILNGGNFNTATGYQALSNNLTGGGNIALGYRAGFNLTTGSGNIIIGNPGVAGEGSTIRVGTSQTRAFIAGIFGKTAGGGIQVFVNNQGQLGTTRSSARYKRDIQEMGEESQGLLKLRPVTFHYKEDSEGQRQYGLIAEEVAKVYPELVVRGEKGEVESVQYHELIPMLLNEVQHQHQALTAQSQQLAELKAQNTRLQAALVQQNVALAARLEQLEQGTRGMTTVSTR